MIYRFMEPLLLLHVCRALGLDMYWNAHTTKGQEKEGS